MTCAVRQLMEERAIVVLGALEAVPVRHPNLVNGFAVAGTIAAVIDVGLTAP